MAGDPDTFSRGQYHSDQLTAVPVGGATGGDGVTTSLWFEADVYSSTPGSAVSLSAEAQPVGTAFTGTATTTSMARPLKETLLPTSRRGSNLIYDTKNKRFILFGGFDGTTRYNEVWELSAGSAYSRWHKLAPTGTAPAARNLGAAVFVRGTTSGSVDKAYMVIWGGAIPGDTNTMAALDLSTPGSEAWISVTQTNTPAARSYLTHHMVATSVNTSASDLYLFGGWGSSRTNDLVRCTFDVNTPTVVTWTTLKANGTAGNPPGRSGTAMIYDSANDRLVITCGYTGAAYLSDTWSYSIAGNTFTQLSPGGAAPAIRELPSIGYDVINQRAILLGGWQGAATNNRNDIFQLSLASGSETWTQIKSNDLNNQAVLAFSSAAAAVDTDRNLLVTAMILGYDSTSKYVYCFDMKDASPTAPLFGLTTMDDFRARDAPGYVYNPVRGEWLLINGYSAMDDDTTISRGEHVSEVWAYDSVKNQWRYAAKGPLSMPQSEGGLAVYDGANDRVIYFGGLTGTNRRLNDVWQLKADEYGMYVATRLAPAGTPPTQRWLMAGCYDAANQRMVLWGGQSAAGVLGDVWSLSLTPGAETWTQLTPGGTAPAAAWQPSFAYDDATKRLYIHGGATDANGTTYTSQLFYLDVSTTNCTWTNTGVTGGLGVRGAVMGYDATNQRLVCFGGFNGTAVNNTLRYTSTGSFTTWTTQAAPNAPSARRSAGCLFTGGTFFVACGRPVSGTWFRDTHQLNASATPGSWSWTALAPTAHQVVAVPVTGLIDRASYHWQAWTVVGPTVGTPSPFGGNAESAADFIPGAPGGRVKVSSGSWTAKPVKVWTGSAWVTKPAKVWDGTAWIETSY